MNIEQISCLEKKQYSALLGGSIIGDLHVRKDIAVKNPIVKFIAVKKKAGTCRDWKASHVPFGYASRSCISSKRASVNLVGKN